LLTSYRLANEVEDSNEDLTKTESKAQAAPSTTQRSKSFLTGGQSEP
jgi:hypothetical protein